MSQFEVVFLDMDGVLADFVGATIRLFERDVEAVLDRWPVGVYEAEKVLGISSKTMWDAILAKGSGFWSDLEEYPWTRRLYALCRRRCDEVVFLSSPSRDPCCLDGKLQWLQRFTGDAAMRNFAFTPQKHLLASPRRLLIDDASFNCAAFGRAGGEAIKFPQPWNGNRNVSDKVSFVEERLRCMKNYSPTRRGRQRT